MKSTLQITREVQTSNDSIASKFTVYRTLRKMEQKNKNHVSASEIADEFDTWTIPALYRYM